ncbi:Protein BM-MTM-9, isoform e [Operophtera brumata]|uniref:Protein BM-MTM-9, isoform e n=1 Tax=Operophtera brumata TaxID=104452 RepID=A0A0L7L9H6_OPEBR|nr:Protein BM-MTM-9, isoform e [Operophtera brumata]
MRAGQPLYGAKHRRCRPDEAILNTVVAIGTKGVIYDLRSSNSISQQQNKACNDREISSDKWISKLESCGWAENVRNSLHTSCIVAQHIHQRNEAIRACLRTFIRGTFLCDNEQERESRGVYTQTTSIWSWVNQPDELSAYINPLYEPTPTVIWPSVAPMSYTTSIWSWVNQPDELSAYINPLYEPTPTVIWPSVAPMSCIIWEGKGSQTTSIWSWVNQLDELSAYINPLYEPTPTVIWPSVAPMSYIIWEGKGSQTTSIWSWVNQPDELSAYINPLYEPTPTVIWPTVIWPSVAPIDFRTIREREQQFKAQAQQLRRELYEVANQYYGPNTDTA